MCPEGEICDSESTIELDTPWIPKKCLPAAGTQYIQERRMVTTYRDFRIPCTCVDIKCPQISAISYDNILRHPEFGGPVWMKVIHPKRADWNGLLTKFPEFSHSVYRVHMIVEHWDYYSQVPRTGKSAFVKLLIKTIADDRRLMIKPELAEKLWDICPERYKTRFECAARARVHNEIQEDVLQYLEHYRWEFKDELGDASIEKIYKRFIHHVHEKNFLLNPRRNMDELDSWD